VRLSGRTEGENIDRLNQFQRAWRESNQTVGLSNCFMALLIQLINFVIDSIVILSVEFI
jgi:hypothetical protein